MPFPAVEATWAAIRGGGLELTLRSADFETERIPVAFESDDDVHFASAGDLVFARAAGEVAVEDWYVWQGSRLLAYDKLDRPILLRAGERATFPPGALKLELRS